MNLEIGKAYSHPSFSGYFICINIKDDEAFVYWYTNGGTLQGIDQIKPTKEFMEFVYEVKKDSL